MSPKRSTYTVPSSSERISITSNSSDDLTLSTRISSGSRVQPVRHQHPPVVPSAPRLDTSTASSTHSSDIWVNGSWISSFCFTIGYFNCKLHPEQWHLSQWQLNYKHDYIDVWFSDSPFVIKLWINYLLFTCVLQLLTKPRYDLIKA